MNKTLAGRYEEFKEVITDDLVERGINYGSLFNLLTIVMEDNAKLIERLKTASNMMIGMEAQKGRMNPQHNQITQYIIPILTETDPNREIEL